MCELPIINTYTLGQLALRKTKLDQAREDYELNIISLEEYAKVLREDNI